MKCKTLLPENVDRDPRWCEEAPTCHYAHRAMVGKVETRPAKTEGGLRIELQIELQIRVDRTMTFGDTHRVEPYYLTTRFLVPE